MDNLDKIHYRDSKKRFKKYSNEKLIIETLHTLLNDMDELKLHHIYMYKKDASNEALKDELRHRINGPVLKEITEGK